MFAERLIERQGRRLNLAEGPAHGPPLLFLHGVCRGWRDFTPLFPAVLPRWRVLAIDFRGHGNSERTPREYHVADYALDALAVLAQLDEPAVIYGHSLGGLAAIAAAAALPERVRAVILEDPPSAELIKHIKDTSFFAQFSGMQLLAGDPGPVAEVARQLAAIPLPGPAGTTVRLGELRDAAALRFGARCLKDLDPEVLSPLIAGDWLHHFDVEQVLRSVKCPALLLRGDETRGGMLGRAEATTWASWMSDCTMIDVPCGHLIHWLATETTVRLMLSFLESLR